MSQLLPIERSDRHPHPRRVGVFLDGLLPEGNARANYAMDVGVPSEDTFGLISPYGRDTAGALVSQPVDEPEPVRVGHYEPLTDSEVGRRLLEADRHSPTDAGERGVESISLAGMQPKLGLHRINGEWHACLRGAPSTWIIKLAHPRDSIASDVVDTEVLALDLARAVDLTTVTAELHDFDGVRAIAVTRYDRVEDLADGRLLRVHQEDLAQALGINTDDPNRKFQRGNRMPSFRLAAEVLRDGGSEPSELLRLVTFNYVIGNTDAHAKNISFLRLSDGTARLAPAYDVALHLHHEREQALSAMDINSKYRLNDMTIADVIAEGVSWGVTDRRSRAVVFSAVSDIRDALAGLDLTAYPGVPERALAVLQKRISDSLGPLDARDDVQTSSNRTARRGPRRR